jgi:outer membrane protein OmpA-like peptidoglycan-associated protein
VCSIFFGANRRRYFSVPQLGDVFWRISWILAGFADGPGNLMRLIFRFSAIFTILILVASPGAAIDADSLIKSLTADGATVTRSGEPMQMLGERDRDYLASLPTRGLKAVHREEVREIVETNQLPRIDVDIRFRYDSAEFEPASIPDLDALGFALTHKSLATARVLLSGHTDAIGGNDSNMALSERRAEAVRDYLVKSFSIAASRLIALGHGEERLKNAVDPEAAENRRVEVVNLGP